MEIAESLGEIITLYIAVATISVLAALPCSLKIITSLALKRLLDSFKNLQIVVHILLIDVFTVAHCEVFIVYVLQISNLQLFDLSKPIVEHLPVNENEAINLHFERSGYEYSDSILSMGSVIVTIIVAPFLVAMILVMRYLCCCQRVRDFSKRQLDLTLFNRTINFLDA